MLGFGLELLSENISSTHVDSSAKAIYEKAWLFSSYNALDGPRHWPTISHKIVRYLQNKDGLRKLATNEK